MKGKARIPNLTHERVIEALAYNPLTGAFTWKIRIAYNVYPGTVAGRNSKAGGYPYVRIDNEEVTCARLAFFYMTGKWPERRVRFINGDKTDCRWENLTLYNGLAGEFDHKTKEGRQAYQNAYRKLVPQTEKARALRESFGITLAQYQEMHENQGGRCAICGNPETQMRNGKIKMLAVDHCHSTGKIRSLLCCECNQGLGKFKDSPELLLNAAEYLKKHASGEQPEASRQLALQTGLADAAQTVGQNLVQKGE